MSAQAEEEATAATKTEEVVLPAATDEEKQQKQGTAVGGGPPKQPPPVKEKRALTADELAIINDPAKFREYCFMAQRDMIDNLKSVHAEQKAQKTREGELAAHVALNALENAKLHEQFKHKTISRAIAKRMNELAAEAGVAPIDLETYSVEQLGLEGGMANAAAQSEKNVEDAATEKASEHDQQQTSGKHNEEQGKKSSSSSNTRKRDGKAPEVVVKKPKKQEDPRHADEDSNVPDPDGITLPGNIHSRENNPVITRWGFRGTSIKGRSGCIIRVPPGVQLAITPPVTKAAKAAAAEMGSKKERLSSAKVFGDTIFKYVEVVLNHLVDKKKEHAPFLFEDLVDVPDATSARAFNDKQPTIWAELVREAHANMKLHGADLGVPLAGVRLAVPLLRAKVSALGKPKKEAAASEQKKANVKKVDSEDDEYEHDPDF